MFYICVLFDCRGGSFGSLQVRYYTSELDIIEEALRQYPELADYFTPDRGLAPLRPEVGTAWNVNNQPDPLQVKISRTTIS